MDVWIACSSYINYAGSGKHQGLEGSKGGDLFPRGFELALAAGAKAIVWENVNGSGVA